MSECPQPCDHLSQEDAREGRTCSEHPCACDGEREALATAIRKGSGASKYQADLLASQMLPHLAGFRRTEVPEPSAEDYPDGWFVFGSHAPYPWVGKMEFSAEKDEAGMPLWERPVQGEPSDLVRRLVELRSDMRHNADEVATLDAAITALGAQGEPSDAQVEAAWAVLERDGLTVLERAHVRDALRAAWGAR